MGKTKPPKGKGAKRPKGANGRPAPPPAEPGFDILTLDEAAALLRVPAAALKADAERGAVPARLVGGEWRFARPTLWSWVTSPPVSPAPRQKLVDLLYSDETSEEQEAYRKRMQEIRDECGTVGDDPR